MDAHCASSRTSIVCRCLDTMHSTAASPGSRPKRSRRSMIWWCMRRSTSNWRTAKSCVSTPRWCRPTFIIRPTTRCCGMWYAWLHAWSAASPKLERRRIKGFCDRTRAARRRMLAIQRMTTTQRHHQQRGKYRELIGIAEEVIESARTALRQTRKARGKDMITDLAMAEIRKEIEQFCGLGARVIDQSRRRFLNGEQVPTAEKIYSIFEPHTDLIKRGKVQTPIEFGHKVFLAESARGLITQYESVGRKSRRRAACDCLAGAPQADLRRRPQIVWIGSRLLQRNERDVVQAGRRQGGVHPTARRRQSARARSL